jgi:CPA2 family monovalent cation:H+ antiporter-2
VQVNQSLLLDIIVALAAGWLGGVLARFARAPLVVGYLLAGVLVGPHAFALVADGDHVRVLATLGVAFLLFALGVQFSLDDLLRVRRVGLYGGLLQVLAMIGLGFGLGLALGWAPSAGLVLGFILAGSSTTVLVKLLNERGEAHAQYAKVALGISITQDLSTVAMVGLLPALATLSFAVLPEMGLLLGRAALLLALVFVLARTGMPVLLRRVSQSGSRELFLATVIVVCLAGAVTAQLLGLSLALGAFLAGIMISESEFHHETYSLVVPLRDIFGLLFFVSLGMFFDPGVMIRHWPEIVLVIAVLFLGKSLIVFVLALWGGYHLRTAIMTALALLPISEYSFLIAILAATAPLGYLSGIQYSTVIAAAIISIALTPLLLGLGTPLYRRLGRMPYFHRFLRAAREHDALEQARAFTGHILVCGYGRVGRIVSDALRNFQVPVVVIDYDQRQVADLRREGVFALYGDASSLPLLQQSGAAQAEMAVICLPDSRSMLLTLRHLRELNTDLALVARGMTTDDLERGYAAGAEEVVEAEFECGLELARHTLLRLDFEADLVQHYVDQVRLFRYRSELWQQQESPPEPE